MNTAVLALPSPAAEAEPRRVATASDWSETEPACWRSEAFAEDVVDLLLPPAQAGYAQPARPLLHRAMALVLRR